MEGSRVASLLLDLGMCPSSQRNQFGSHGGILEFMETWDGFRFDFLALFDWWARRSRGYRRAMVKSMTAAAQVPHFHFCDEVRMEELVRVRDNVRKVSKQKITFLPFIIKVCLEPQSVASLVRAQKTVPCMLLFW